MTEKRTKLFRWYLAPGYKLSSCLNDVRDYGVGGIHGTPIASRGEGLRPVLITMTIEHGDIELSRARRVKKAGK